MRRALPLLVAFACLAPAGPARAGLDLHGVPRAGVTGSDTATLAGAGDVNGDGVPDFAAGLELDLRAPEPGPLPPEIAVVGFGPAAPDPAAAGFSGLVVTHLNEPALQDDRGRVSFGQSAGGAVAGVGDWNGDGLADVAFGATGAGPHRRPDAGSVYVVLGRRAPGTVDVRHDPGVVRIDGPARASEIGGVLGAAGDVDGDGRPDLAIALPGRRAVIVRGGLPAGTTLDLAHPPAGTTLQLRGLDAGRAPREPPGGRPLPKRPPDPAVAAFAALGDLDGDGRGEVAVGLPAADALREAGRVLVLRGAGFGTTVDAADARARIARIVGPHGYPGFGGALSAVPDSDGDGRPELLVGAAAPPGLFGIPGDLPSGAFVVFSRARGEVRPGRSGQPAVVVDTRGRGSHAGATVAGVPDLTGDGVPDLLIGLPDASPRCRGAAGAVALVAGRRTPGRVRVGAALPRWDGPEIHGGLGGVLAVSGSAALVASLPFENAGELDLWRVPLSGLSGPSPALPAARRCLSVTVAKRGRAAIRRAGAVRVTVHSDAGDGRAHRLRLKVYVYTRRREHDAPQRAVSLPGAGTRHLRLELPRGAGALLAGRARVFIGVTAEQRVGSGSRATSGAFAGAVLRL